MTLGPLVSLEEGGVAPRPVMETRMAMADSMPIAAGETMIGARVTAVYAIGE